MTSEEEKADEAVAKECGSIHRAAGNGNVAALRHFVRSDPGSVHKGDTYGDTPLHEAAGKGKVACAEFLLANSAAVDATNKYGRTPLHSAALYGTVACAQLLLANGAAVDATNNAGKTPLDYARMFGKTEMVEFLQNWREAKKADDSKKASEAQQPPVYTFSPSSREPSKEAAKELQEAMASSDVQVLKKAIDNAKLHKVSQEDVMKALEKCIALQEAVTQSAAPPAKEATTSKAESSVKLEPGHGARLAMFSARFNEKNKDTEHKFRAVHKLLVENHYEVLMVEAGEGESFGELTAEYLGRLKRENGTMLAVCTSDYGEMTISPFCTYYELKTAVEYKIDVLPLQVEDEWQPNPPCGKGHLDDRKRALGFIDLVFTPSHVRLDCRNKSVEDIASKIAAVLRKPV